MVNKLKYKLTNKNPNTLTSKEKKKLEKMKNRKLEKEERKQRIKQNLEPFEHDKPFINPKLRTKEDRIKQVDNLKEKLSEVGFYDSLSGYQKFVEISNDFIKNGNYTESKIKFDEIPGVYINVLLSPKINVDCSITVKNWKVPSSAYKRSFKLEKMMKKIEDD